ncbi:hypothetical protein I316_07605 [Kwoniella heveanensis BCC8398]|uniref:ubiquitinyl hydrolase 1 n=1 Tax=Kwoniella heveanensis BCC8398 TaxID=1296120 RepID=A0A1B9GI88_9TREE|nr:hypothetical protein I316_07605 [Kwoniella heveanensis BCC8398]
MSRSLPQPPLNTLSFSSLQALANEQQDIQSQTPKAWFMRATHEVDLAVIAERTKKKEETFLAYTRACQAYVNAKMHPQFSEEKKSDPQWAQRVKEFKPSYETYLVKAKDLKEDLKRRDVEKNGSSSSSSSRPTPSRSPSGPEVKNMGSIADRMKALGGHGMDVGSSSRRISRDIAPPPSAPRPTTHSSTSLPSASNANGHLNTPSTNAGGNLGSLRTTNANSTSNRERKDKPSPPTVQQSVTGSSTRSRRSTNPIEVERSQVVTPNYSTLSPSVPAHRVVSPAVPPAPAEPGPSNKPAHPLPTVPQSTSRRDIHHDEPHEADLSTNTLKDFEKAFPSLSEFGKQWQEEDDDEESRANARIAQWSSSDEGKQKTEIMLPDVPSFPNLPSAPTDRPGLPPPPAPPARAETFNITNGEKDTSTDEKALSPPAPSPGAGLKRPASTPNVATLPGDVDLLTDEPVLEGDRDKHPARPVAPIPPKEHGPTALPNGVVKDSRSPTLSFPVAVPTPPPGQKPFLPKPRDAQQSTATPPTQQSQAQPQAVKPKFPFTNSIEPDGLRSYILNPAVEVLILDVRSQEEFQRGYVGREYEARAKVDIVWIDPLVLLRDGMTSQRLEDSLSLAPDSHRQAFERRDRYDVVVVYDAKSKTWPKKNQDSNSAATAKLWDIIYEHEFTKKLQRNPVLINGGYEAWREFIKMRATTHMNHAAGAQASGHGHGHSHSLALNGQGRPYNPKLSGQSPGLASPRGPDKLMSPSSSGDFSSKRANRDMPVYQPAHYAKNIMDSFGQGPQSMTGEPSSYMGQQPSRSYVQTPSSSHSRTQSNYASPSSTIAPPPQASIHPGPGARRRSDYLDHSSQSYSGGGAAYTPTTSPRPAIDYPQAHALAMVPQPPPAAMSPMERYDTRPAVVRSGSIRGLDLVAREGDEVRYWNDVVLGLTGLKNLGNTCYMNSTIQCLSATFPFTSFFLDGSFKRSINVYNPLGTKGNLANAFAELLKALWKEDYTFLSPVTFRKNIITFASQFSGTDQHDSQEFLSFVLDGLHEDLNRVKHKPPPVEMTPEREAALETLPPEVASEKEWQIYRMRNDSFIVDLFQGQYRNRLECLTCHKTSTTYDAYMYMSLPVPSGKSRVVIQELIDEFVKAEVMEKEDAWNCPRCKVPRRASKTLTIARLPPVLLIQLKRFTTQNGVFWDKSETPVIFPVKGLDLTRHVPYRQATGREDLDDPRTQIGPFRYDLYGVSNHMGTLSSGHYTAYVKSSKGWQFCEDSRITKAGEKDVVVSWA